MKDERCDFNEGLTVTKSNGTKFCSLPPLMTCSNRASILSSPRLLLLAREMSYDANAGPRRSLCCGRRRSTTTRNLVFHSQSKESGGFIVVIGWRSWSMETKGETQRGTISQQRARKASLPPMSNRGCTVHPVFSSNAPFLHARSAYETQEPYDLISKQAIQKWVPLDRRNGVLLRRSALFSARVFFLLSFVRFLSRRRRPTILIPPTLVVSISRRLRH